MRVARARRFAHAGRAGDELLAVDVGGTRIKAALCSGAKLSAPVIERTERTPHGLVAQLAQLHAAHGSPERSALCLPGSVSSGIWWAHQPFPNGPVPIAEMLSELGLPVPFCCRDSELSVRRRSRRTLNRADSARHRNRLRGDGRRRDAVRRPRGAGRTVDGASAAALRRGGVRPMRRARLRIDARLFAWDRRPARKEVSADELRTRALAGEQPYAQVYERTLDAVAKLAQMAAMNFRPEDVRLAGGSAHAWREELIPRLREGLSALPQAAVGPRGTIVGARAAAA